jgi:aminoglycoside phosphotransferase (APT) family kinase protein
MEARDGGRAASPGRDHLATAGRLLGSGLRLLGDRLRGDVFEGVPRRVADATPDWLGEVLRPLEPGLEVRSVEPIGGHSGTTTRARLAVRFGGETALPATLFLKITAAGIAQRLFGHAMRLGEMEVRFYREVAPCLDVRLPRAYCARASRDGARFALLLEDLAGAGASFVEVGERVGPDRAAAVMTALADLHAALWESPRFAADLAWVRSRENRRRELPVERSLTRVMVQRALGRLGADATGELRGVARLVCERRDTLEQFWAEGPRTLVHGDCHVGNLYFLGDEVGFLDWQVLARAPGLRDVAYFLCNSLPSELRERHEQSLLETYRSGLAARGVTPPDREATWLRYRGFALYAWLAAAFTLGAGGLQSDAIARAGLERATRAVTSLGSLELFA